MACYVEGTGAVSPKVERPKDEAAHLRHEVHRLKLVDLHFSSLIYLISEEIILEDEA
jgi:hypothetical protein